MFIRKKKYLEVEREFKRMSERMERKLHQLDVLAKANNSLKRELYNKEKELAEALIKAQELANENKQLADKLAPKLCDGCIHSDNYRKCTSCARYPKIKDKYEMEDM